MKSIDPYTGTEFIPKRSNQIYASAANRIAHNNLKANKITKHLAPINRLLHQYYKVLIELMKNKHKEIFHKQFLLGKGFSFEVITFLDSYEGRNAFLVYEFCVIP